jgi:hypothetical protein
MTISLSRELQRFAEKQARARGLAGPGEYISELLRAEHRQRDASGAALKRRLREGARKRAARDLAVTQEWFSLEEEAHGQGRKG